MDHFGSYLKSQREAKNIRLEEIASITKIHLHNLQLLEKGEWSQLPPEPFIRGFIIAYSKYIGLDSKDTIQRFLEFRNQERPDAAVEEIEELTPARETADPSQVLNKTGWSFQRIAVGGIAIALVAIIAVISYIGKQSTAPLAVEALTESENSTIVTTANENASTENAEVAKVEATEPAKSVVSEAPKSPAEVISRETADQKPASEVSVKAHEIIVEGKERTWMKIVIDDQKPKETFLEEGEVITLTAQDKIKVVLGNSTGTRVVHNGTPTTGEKFSGTIRSYIFPKNARFPQDPPKRLASSQEEKEGEPATSVPPAEAEVTNESQ